MEIISSYFYLEQFCTDFFVDIFCLLVWLSQDNPQEMELLGCRVYTFFMGWRLLIHTFTQSTHSEFGFSSIVGCFSDFRVSWLAERWWFLLPCSLYSSELACGRINHDIRIPIFPYPPYHTTSHPEGLPALVTRCNTGAKWIFTSLQTSVPSIWFYAVTDVHWFSSILMSCFV